MDKLPPLPNPVNQKKGKKNREEGRAFEEILDHTFAYYSSKGYAQIDKTPEPFKIIRRMGEGRFLGCFIKRAQPDYKGTIKGGRTVIFEAKYTSGDRLTQDRVSDIQAAYMDQASALGARCFVLAGFKHGGVYRIPWSDWTSMKEKFGHKYVTENDLQAYRISKSWNDLLLILD
ncbi:MAG: Holliday junction resolvase RecU [Clostridium sp.]|nr:Holliday junction resolvase RecU [Clostridium sp.]